MGFCRGEGLLASHLKGGGHWASRGAPGPPQTAARTARHGRVPSGAHAHRRPFCLFLDHPTVSLAPYQPSESQPWVCQGAGVCITLFLLALCCPSLCWSGLGTLAHTHTPHEEQALFQHLPSLPTASMLSHNHTRVGQRRVGRLAAAVNSHGPVSATEGITGALFQHALHGSAPAPGMPLPSASPPNCVFSTLLIAEQLRCRLAASARASVAFSPGLICWFGFWFGIGLLPYAAAAQPMGTRPHEHTFGAFGASFLKPQQRFRTKRSAPEDANRHTMYIPMACTRRSRCPAPGVLESSPCLHVHCTSAHHTRLGVFVTKLFTALVEAMRACTCVLRIVPQA